MTRLSCAALTLGLLSACVDGSPPPRDPNAEPTNGGTITLANCGYDVSTRVGASAPVMSTAFFGADPRPEQVRLGIPADPATTMAVAWRTADETTLATTGQFGKGTSLDQSQDGFTFIYVGGFNGSGETIRMHETHLCGLDPGTEYSYRVGGVGPGGEESWSPTYTFHTAPAASDTSAEVLVAVLGDSRDGYDVWQKLVDLIGQQSPDLILFSGDAVTIGAVQVEWETFFSEAEPLFARAPVVSAHGNHDVNAINYYSQFVMPGNEEDFGIDYGPFHLTVLNDTPFDPGDISGAARDFLDSDLTAHDSAPWKLLMHHRPIWSASTRHGSDTELLDTWGPVIDAHKVDLVLNGHDHDYERSKPMRGSTPQATAADGTVYIVSGGAGASLYGNGSDFWTEKSEKTHSALLLHISRTMLQMQAIRDDGSELDSMATSK